MPSWPTRLFLGSSNSSPSTPLAPTNDPLTPLRSPPAPTSGGALPRRTSQHGRSISHPFPSIFGSGKKKAAKSEDEDEDDDVVDAKTQSVGTPTSSAADPIGHAHTDPVSREGKCATCDSHVRWPQSLDVFRCTVCLMVNDLKPNLPKRIPDDAQRSHVPHISLTRTEGLIEACVSRYIESLKSNAPIACVSSPLEETKKGVSNARAGYRSPTSPYPIPSRRRRSPPTSPSRPPPGPPIAGSYGSKDPFVPAPGRSRSDSSRSIFRSLENYIIACFNGIECVNASFSLAKPTLSARAKSESSMLPTLQSSEPIRAIDLHTTLSPVDAKTLLLGDFAENGTWWAGSTKTERSRSHKATVQSPDRTTNDRITLRSPLINWRELDEWYSCIINVARCSKDVVEKLKSKTSGLDDLQLSHIEEHIRDSSFHVQKTLLKASENLLRRPGRPLKTPADCRFLLILLANPLLYPDNRHHLTDGNTDQSVKQDKDPTFLKAPETSAGIFPPGSPSNRNKAGGAATHSGITKRIFGLLSTLPIDCHHHLISWFSQLAEPHFRRIVDLVGSFVTYRLSRQLNRKVSRSQDPNGGLVPSLSGSGISSSAQLHAALGITVNKPAEQKANSVAYGEDWQIKAAARVMSLLFSANNSGRLRRQPTLSDPTDHDSWTSKTAANRRANRHGQLLPTSTFYNTLLDYSDLVVDFETWESRRGKFSFCQYPMFLSLWAKIHIMEHDARRQMEIKAREAFFDSIMNRKAVSQYLVLRVRRDCLVEDSLRGVSEVVGTGQEEIKKGLRIEFTNEEGVDAGGLRKEWFLLLVREVFDPEHGLFVYDEESHYCYFNPNSFETSDQFFLVGVVLGLAIYNSTILDVALPPFAFRKLLASAPIHTGPSISSTRPSMAYTLDDLAEFRPALAKGLRQLLEYDGDVEETFCRDFVAEVERYGQVIQFPLCPQGERRPVTNSNRREFVDLYVRYLMDIAVARQYEPFKRGFFTVCGGNALSLFRPEEIELLVRGSDEPLDVATLQAVATYDGWGKSILPAEEPVIIWFWEAFKNAEPAEQRSLLSFITSSDRIPAMGAASLVIKIARLGDDSERFPTARTCFNRIGLYRYRNRQQLETKLWRAVAESEGFGLK